MKKDISVPWGATCESSSNSGLQPSAETFTISKGWVLTMGFFRQALGFLCPPAGFYFQKAGIHFSPCLPLGFHRARSKHILLLTTGSEPGAQESQPRTNLKNKSLRFYGGEGGHWSGHGCKASTYMIVCTCSRQAVVFIIGSTMYFSDICHSGSLHGTWHVHLHRKHNVFREVHILPGPLYSGPGNLGPSKMLFSTYWF